MKRLIVLVTTLLLLAACQDAQNVPGYTLEGQVSGWAAAEPRTISALPSNQPLLLGESTIQPDGSFHITLRTPRTLELIPTELCDAPGQRLEARVLSLLGLRVEGATGQPAGLIVLTNDLAYGSLFYAAESVTITPECRERQEMSFILPEGWSVVLEDLVTGQVTVVDRVPADARWRFQSVEP